MRALEEAARDADVIVLCEGDMTFSAWDVKKLLSYLENCDLVLGTRATQELRQNGSQMDWLINPGNQIVAKLIQCRFWGTRLTDWAAPTGPSASRPTAASNTSSMSAATTSRRICSLKHSSSASGSLRSRGLPEARRLLQGRRLQQAQGRQVALKMLGLLYRA